jgi:hypothetical protein
MMADITTRKHADEGIQVLKCFQKPTGEDVLRRRRIKRISPHARQFDFFTVPHLPGATIRGALLRATGEVLCQVSGCGGRLSITEHRRAKSAQLILSHPE